MRPPQWFKKLVVPLANQIVHASDAYVGLKSTINDMSSTLIDFSRPPAGPADQRLLEFARLIRPWTDEGLELVRVGGESDGGYVMANDFDVAGAISIGIGSDVSWDVDLANRGIHVAMFDPTIRKPANPVPHARFHKLGLGPKELGRSYRSLAQIVDIAGWPVDSDLILKIDIEGDEWQSLVECQPVLLSRFRQVVVEFHDLRRLKGIGSGAVMLAALHRLNETHRVIHVHANNYANLVRLGNYWFVDALEISFMRHDMFKRASRATVVRSTLDRRCDPRAAEISLEALAAI